jgi:hypothetical protein
MQYFFARDPEAPFDQADIVEMLGILGSFLLEIRKSVGNETSKLDKWQMLEWFVTDAAAYRELEQSIQSTDSRNRSAQTAD